MARAGHEAAVNRARQGLRTTASMRVASAVRSATAPVAPTIWNSVLASEAPACIELIAMSNKRTDVTGEPCGLRVLAVIRAGIGRRMFPAWLAWVSGEDCPGLPADTVR